MVGQVVPNQAFLKELHQQWNQNPVIATLSARLRPMEIPPEVIQLAGNSQQVAQQTHDRLREQQQIQDTVNASLGAMGIFGNSGSFGSGMNFGFGQQDPDKLLFYGTMAAIRMYQGDPPTTPALKAHAVAILQGQIDPMQALVLGGSQSPVEAQLLQGFLPMLGSMLGNMYSIFQRQALVMAALAVPHDQIPGLLGNSKAT